MATLTIKNLPDKLYGRLKSKAAKHRRSINSEAILAIESAVLETSADDLPDLLARLRRSRASIRGIHLTDKALRNARESGRR